MRVGVLHPGNMGAALAACLEGEVFWASEGRSEATVERAKEAEIVDLGTVESLVNVVDVIFSVCPPAGAVDLAGRVSELGFDGLYVDANAVSPSTARQISQLFDRFVDGGIVGTPPTSRPAKPSSPEQSDAAHTGGTRLYLSGGEASSVKALLAGSEIDVRVLGSEPGKASALKMAYAAWTKGTSALLLSVGALATSGGVTEELYEEWDLSIPELRQRLEQISAGVGQKAWRFVGEMEQIAQSYGDAGLPDGFHLAATDVSPGLPLSRIIRQASLPPP